MRTKTLLMAAAALAAGVISSQAQPVYSQNVVGYVNQVFPPSVYQVANNPLNLDNTNTADNVFASGLQGGDTLLFWSVPLQTYQSYTFAAPGVWVYPDGSIQSTGPALPAGATYFYLNGQGGKETNTFVGSVVFSNNVVFQPSIYELVSSGVPISDTLDGTNINLPLQGGDTILYWSTPLQTYQSYTYAAQGVWVYPDGSIQSTGPVVNVGQGFFYLNGQGGAETWTNNFTLQ
jgi:hypothetical protein